MVESENSWLGKILHDAEAEASDVDLFCPYGKGLICTEHDADNYDDTTKDFDQSAVEYERSVPPEPDLEGATVSPRKPWDNTILALNLTA